MDLYLYIIFAAVSFFASVAGAVCGIGGGVLIKPVLDAFGVLSVPDINFLSGCTVLSMSCYSVWKDRSGGYSRIDMKIEMPLAAGAVAGGGAGRMLFQYLCGVMEDKNRAGGIQAGCLLILTVCTLLYVLNKDKIRSLHVTSAPACLIIGMALGVFSSFLGIGGGPVNLAVLFFFFSMDAKTAAQNSLYIIFFSQAASLIQSLASGMLQDFEGFGTGALLLMSFCGILGGAVGRKVNRRIGNRRVRQLFIGLMAAIILVCVYNMTRFM